MKTDGKRWAISLIGAMSMVLVMTCLAAAQTAGGALPIPVPTATGPVPVSSDSLPFSTASRSEPAIDLAAQGYLEEEFFVTGTGNVYDWAPDGSIKVRTPGLPFTTRILVRRPSDKTRFSGTVLVDVSNRGDGFDTYATWGQLHDYLLANRHAYVGVTAFAGNVAALKKFNPARYAPLSFPKPAETCGPAGRAPEFEDGVRWDVISQIGALLKSNAQSNPLAGYAVQYVYASMQSAGDMPTYVNAFPRNMKLGNGKPAYDAFLIKDSGGPGALNSCAQRLAEGDPRLVIRNVGVPVIQILAQNAITANTRRPDSDAAGDQFRRYELPGASHFDLWHFMYRPPLKDITAAGIKPEDYFQVPRECEPARAPINDFPQPYFFNAAFANLDQWVRKGTPPPKAGFVELKDGKGPEFVNDEFGNVRGGIRSPWFDVPAGTFYPEMKGPGMCRSIGYWAPFSWTRLEALYGNRQNYTKKFLESVDRLVTEHWVTAADGDKLKADLQLR